ncbi:hypothetical protein AJ87_46915 [Rhizobium yanglingense]|nr:hypothetical protein AJ87_46915 [Rhizobium yanglingense]
MEEADTTVESQSKIVLFLNTYKFRIEPDTVLPCEPRDDAGADPLAGASPVAPDAVSEPALFVGTVKMHRSWLGP